MSTLSIAPESTRTVPTVRGGDRRVGLRSSRSLPATPAFDFDSPVTALGQDDPAVRVLEAPPVGGAISTDVPAGEPARLSVEAVRVRRSTVRLTRRGRLTVTLTFLALVLAAMVAVGSTWASASLSGGEPEPVQVVVVQPGDTLYGIASSMAEPGEVRDMVHRIQELNALPSATIAEGQELAVPRG